MTPSGLVAAVAVCALAVLALRLIWACIWSGAGSRLGVALFAAVLVLALLAVMVGAVLRTAAMIDAALLLVIAAALAALAIAKRARFAAMDAPQAPLTAPDRDEATAR